MSALPLGHLRDGHFAGLVLLTPEVLRHLDLERRPQHSLRQPGEQAAKPNEADVLLEQLLGDRYGGRENSGLEIILTRTGGGASTAGSRGPAYGVCGNARYGQGREGHLRRRGIRRRPVRHHHRCWAENDPEGLESSRRIAARIAREVKLVEVDLEMFNGFLSQGNDATLVPLTPSMTLLWWRL